MQVAAGRVAAHGADVFAPLLPGGQPQTELEQAGDRFEGDRILPRRRGGVQVVVRRRCGLRNDRQQNTGRLVVVAKRIGPVVPVEMSKVISEPVEIVLGMFVVGGGLFDSSHGRSGLN